MRRVLRVSMTTGLCAYAPLPEHLALLGGRGLSLALIAESGSPRSRSLDRDEPLVFAPGLLAGTPCASANRLSVGFVSPLTGLPHEANAGGPAAAYLARLGIAAVVIEGGTRNTGFRHLIIEPHAARLGPAISHGQGNIAAVRTLADRHGPGCVCISIGPAGELGLATASIAFSDRRQRPSRHAGSGGGGAVMGGKGLKAIVVIPPERQTVPLHDPQSFSATANAFAETLSAYRDEHTGPRRSGDCGDCLMRCAGASDRSFGRGKWPGYQDFWSAPGRSPQEDAAYAARFVALCDDIGVDVFQTALGLALLQRAEKLAKGDAQGALRLVEEMAAGTGTGKLLGAGAHVVANSLGLDVDAVPSIGAPETSVLEDDPIFEAAVDTLGICRFAAQALRHSPEAVSALGSAVAALFGHGLRDRWLEDLGSRALAAQTTCEASSREPGRPPAATHSGIHRRKAGVPPHS